MHKDKYPVNRGINNNLPVKENILTRITELLETFTQKHSKTLVIRFDVHYPETYKTTGRNWDIMKFTAVLIQKHKRNGLDPHYIWVREREKSANPHYHFCLLLNGNKAQKWYHIVEDVEVLWHLALKADVAGCINYCNKDKYGNKQNNGIMLDRAKPDFDIKFRSVHRHLSYLAKERGKTLPRGAARNFGMSTRLKEKRKLAELRNSRLADRKDRQLQDAALHKENVCPKNHSEP